MGSRGSDYMECPGSPCYLTPTPRLRPRRAISPRRNTLDPQLVYGLGPRRGLGRLHPHPVCLLWFAARCSGSRHSGPLPPIEPTGAQLDRARDAYRVVEEAHEVDPRNESGLVAAAKRLRMELLTTKAELERELGRFLLHCHRCTAACIGCRESERSRVIGDMLNPLRATNPH
jgi:hypothetical protein